MNTILEICKRAKAASATLASMSSAQKNKALSLIAESLELNKENIIAANKIDVELAEKSGTSKVMLDRLIFNESRIKSSCDGISQVVSLPDPIGTIDNGFVRDNGLKILKVRVPIGVIGIIYESRPNVTVDVAALCLKSGNVCILRGGKEAINTNSALAECMRKALTCGGFSADFVNLIEDTDRQATAEFMKMRKYVDCLIPRGGAGLIKAVSENSNIPVIETGAGLCHIYVDKAADFDQAANIVFNAKTSRPSVCNSADCLLVHKSVAEHFLPFVKNMLDKKDVQLHCCPQSLAILQGCDMVVAASDIDYDTEFLDYILAVKVVDSLSDAIAHIATHGTGHSEAIITRDIGRAERFVQTVDAAAVYVNASTRFTDGEVFGLGAEIGISTQKLHARGPMGLKELTTTKYTIYGDGQVR